MKKGKLRLGWGRCVCVCVEELVEGGGRKGGGGVVEAATRLKASRAKCARTLEGKDGGTERKAVEEKNVEEGQRLGNVEDAPLG